MAIVSAVTHRVIGTEAEIVDDTRLRVRPAFDLLYVPGGLGTMALMDDRRAIDYLASWGSEARMKIAAQMEYRGYSPL